MAWIIKHMHSFNKYMGEDNKVVNSISEAKEFKTKKSATEAMAGIKTVLEVVKKI